MKTHESIPLVRFLAMAGHGSRRHCDSLITSGYVTVNDTVAGPGTRVVPGRDVVKVRGEVAAEPPVYIYLLLNKPKGYLVSDSDPENRPLAKDLLPDFKMRMFPVGRLDFQTEGAILFTNDGLWADAIAHPRNRIPKTYLAKVRNIPTRSTLDRWLKGVRDKGQTLKASRVSIEKVTKKNAWLKITLTGGANRQVRRMGRSTGHPVVKLIRLSIGSVDIGTLKPGESRELNPREIKQLKNPDPPQPAPARQRSDRAVKKRIQTRKHRRSRSRPSTGQRGKK